MCEHCNREFNRTYLSKHIESCLIKKIHSSAYNKINDKQSNDINDNELSYKNNGNNTNLNKRLIVSPSFCGKTHLLLKK